MRIKNLVVMAVLATAVLCFGLLPTGAASLAHATPLWAGLTADVSNSDLIAQLQAQIASLMAQLQALQGQTSTPQTWCYTFTRNLKVGDSGGDVSALMQALDKEGLLPYRLATYGNSFDESIASAVTSFQEKYASEILTPSGLTHGTGYVGPATRAKLNALYACGPTPGPAPTPVPVPMPTPVTPVGGYQYLPTASGVSGTGSLVSASEDIVWKVVDPTNHSTDWKWQFTIQNSNTANKAIKRMILVSNASGEGWSTDDTANNPVGKSLYLLATLPVDSPSYYLFNSYSSVLGMSVPANGSRSFYAYGYPGSPSFPGGTLVVEFTDGTGTNITVPSSTLTPTNKTPIPTTSFSFTFPTAGSNLQIGQTYNITWTGSDPNVPNYAVYLVGGPLGSTGSIFLGTAYPRADGSVGTFSWTLSPNSYAPNGFTPGSGYQIQLSAKGASGGNSPSFNIVSGSTTTPSITYKADFDGGTLYGSLYRSYDGGNTWKEILRQYKGRIVYATDSKNLSIIYAGYTGGNMMAENMGVDLFKSTNAGDAWTSISQGIINQIGTLYGVSSISVDSNNSDIVKATVSSGSLNSIVFQSTDGGSTWINLSTQPPSVSPTITAVGYPASQSNQFYPGTTVTVFGSGLPASGTIQMDHIGTVEHVFVTASPSPSGQQLYFTAPSTMSSGTFNLYLVNSPNGGSQISNVIQVTVLSSTSTTPSITVTYPNGGENLVEGQEYTIRWSSVGLPADAKIGIQLFRSDGTNRGNPIVNNLPATQGQYTWRFTTAGDWGFGLNSYMVKFAKLLGIGIADAAGYQYKILVSASWTTTDGSNGGYGNAYDYSNNYFSIVASQGLSVTQNSAFSNRTINPNTTNVQIGSYTIQNVSATAPMSIYALRVGQSGTVPLTDITNLTISGVTNSYPHLTVSGNDYFAVNDSLAPGASITIDIFASTGPSTTGTIKTALTVSAVDSVNYNQNTSSSVTGQTMTLVAATVTPSISVSPSATFSMSSQYISPNTPNVKIGSYLVQNQSAEAVRLTMLNVQEITSGVSLTNFANVKTSDTTGSGTVKLMPSGSDYFAVNDVLQSGASETIDIFASAGPATSGTIQTKLSVQAVGVTSNNLTPSSLATGPTLTINSGSAVTPVVTVASGNGTITSGTQNQIGQATVSVPSSGSAKINTITFDTTYDAASGLLLQYPYITANSASVPDSSCAMSATGITCTLGSGYSIPTSSGQSTVSFNLYATLAGIASGSSATISTSLDRAGFIWNDTSTGSSITNFPTNSYTIHQ